MASIVTKFPTVAKVQWCWPDQLAPSRFLHFTAEIGGGRRSSPLILMVLFEECRLEVQTALHCCERVRRACPSVPQLQETTLARPPNFKQQKQRREDMQKKKNEEKQRQNAARKENAQQPPKP